jgi:hypothetical protein
VASSPHLSDPRFRMVFARIVTHYFRRHCWLDDGVLLREAGKLAGIPGILIQAGSIWAARLPPHGSWSGPGPTPS